MADPRHSLPGNIPGNLFVDSTCIDCDLCRQIAPAVFWEELDHSVVFHQPGNLRESRSALMALVACPTGSIGTREKTDLKPAIAAYPERIEDNVFFCGFASRHSYGAASYLIVRPEGNVLVDSPRFAGPLIERLEALGGVRWMFLTHRDDVADHDQFHRRFRCERILHRDDALGLDLERMPAGRNPVELDRDLVAVPVPGHTRGHMVLLYRQKFLFTGDHLAWSDARNRLIAFRSVTWYSWSEQTRSMERLFDYDFEWVLPGHGRRARKPAALMRRKLADCVGWMKTVA